MYHSLRIFNDENFLATLDDLGEKNISLNELDPNTREKLDAWLIAGLDRGLLGEYRAWLTTLLIYNEGLKDGTFTEIPWLEEIKSSRPTDVELPVHLFRFLSPSWVDPTLSSGWFSYQFVRQALKELRQKLFNDPAQIKMGQLGRILQLKN